MSNNYREILKNEFERRRAKNARYSVRAFARDLNLNSTGVLRVLRGDLGLSLKAASQIAANLRMSAVEAKRFIDTVAKEMIAEAVATSNPKPACEHFIERSTIEGKE